MSATQIAKLTLFALLPLVRSVTVSTKYGEIEGFIASYPNASGPLKSVSKFLGIPFAAPPIGELRFKAPQPLKAWKPNVLTAKKHGNICIQNKNIDFYFKQFTSNFSYSEDCLFLDVYSPNVSLSLPVMVYIHGGGYQSGAAITHTSDILALQGVVAVVIQYRLGPFGFLTTGDSVSPGNFGMLDQVEALKWVNENIEHFGGNPNQVTIFGESAGGTSVSLHLLSPLSRNLFHRIIAESGVDLSPFAFQSSSFGLRFTKELAEKLSCPTKEHGTMVDCIQAKDAIDVQAANELIRYKYTKEANWAPIVDMNFLHDTPQHLRQKGDFKKAPLMICFTSNEASLFLSLFLNSLELMKNPSDGVSPATFKSFMKKFPLAQKRGNKTAELIAGALEFVYTPWPDNSDKYALRSKLVDLIGDYTFYAPSHEVADFHSQFAPVYMYEFTHKTSFNPWGPNEPWMGVTHGDNIPFDFGIPFLPNFFSMANEADRNVSSLIMAMYVNFARSSDPKVSGVPWEEYNATHRAYLRVNANPKMAASFYPYRMAFWNDYHPKLLQVKFDVGKQVVSGANTFDAIPMFIQIILTVILVIVSVV
ncbi:cocaine esterase-like [Montipora foliosa]|uniref:cocaine esterase-like n=1 Tax=Montipora foliosa TaxID=591990 RepID=UPI0035F18E29